MPAADIPAPPAGYALVDPAASTSQPAAVSISQPPPGYALVDNAAATAPKQEPSVLANAVTGLQSGVGNLLGAPQAIGALASRGGQGTGSFVPDPASLAANYWPSPETINDFLYRVSNRLNPAAGLPPPVPYRPQTPAGQLGQDVLGAVVPALLSGGGAGLSMAKPASALTSIVGGGRIPGALTRIASGTAGTAAGDLYGQQHPDSYWGKLVANLMGALAGGGIGAGVNRLPGISRLGQIGAGNPDMWGVAGASVPAPAPGPAAAAAAQLTKAADMSGPTLTASINQNLPQWTPGTVPTLGDVTGNRGIQNLTYNDRVAAAAAGDSVYQNNAATTSAAQRAAVTAATPSDAARQITDLTAARDTAADAIPQGVSAQEAGAQFRQNLQSVFDQRSAARAAGGASFDSLGNAGPVDMQPVMLHAATQAAQNAGEVGKAYQAALGQFKSATGETLDTPAFAGSVLKGLGDLASSYPAGSASARAVLDVKGRLESTLNDQVPEIGAARAQWAENSRPLDVFETKPFAQVLATDRFGRSYAMPNDAVASSFLRGNGSADSLDALNGVFDDPAAASRGLQDYIAGQVRQNALLPDGTIDVKALQRVTAPYQRALSKLPDLDNQFKTAAGAQQALDAQTALQSLRDKFATGLGTQGTDAAGNPMYSPAQFNKAVRDAQPLLEQAYGKDGAAVINRVDAELSRIAQTDQARVPGTSGTPQALLAGQKGGIRSQIGGLVGTVGGFAIEHMFGEGGLGSFAGPYLGHQAGQAVQNMFNSPSRQAAIDVIRRQALVDPEYARSLLTKYAPAQPTSAAGRAMRYVAVRSASYAPGLPAAVMSTPPYPQGPQMLTPF